MSKEFFVLYDVQEREFTADIFESEEEARESVPGNLIFISSSSEFAGKLAKFRDKFFDGKFGRIKEGEGE